MRLRHSVKDACAVSKVFPRSGLQSSRLLVNRLFSLFERSRKGRSGSGGASKGVLPWRIALVLAGLGAVVLALLPVMPPSAELAPPAAPIHGLEQTVPVSAGTSANDQISVPWQLFTVHSGDTLSTLFKRAGLDRSECARVMALGTNVETLRTLHPGEKLRLRSDDSQALAELRYAPDALRTLEVIAGPSGLHADLQQQKPVLERTSTAGVVHQTLNQALQQTGLSSSLAANFAKIFHWRVDFRREIHPGTRFSLLFDKRRVGSRKLSSGPIVAAELVLHGRTLRAFRFTGADGNPGYYDVHGASMHPTLLRTPVRYSRISSSFSRHRFDPVLQVWRPHYGVDLAADLGTPVKAAGDGRITFQGRDGGYGNLVKIKHFWPYTTRYAHLQRFAPNLKRGSHVRQGQIIGYVGQTGAATGPHLHFEIRVKGIPRNPLKVKLPAGAPLNARERSRFKTIIPPLLVRLDSRERSPSQLASIKRASLPIVQAL